MTAHQKSPSNTRKNNKTLDYSPCLEIGRIFRELLLLMCGWFVPEKVWILINKGQLFGLHYT